MKGFVQKVVYPSDVNASGSTLTRFLDGIGSFGLCSILVHRSCRFSAVQVCTVQVNCSAKNWLPKFSCILVAFGSVTYCATVWAVGRVHALVRDQFHYTSCQVVRHSDCSKSIYEYGRNGSPSFSHRRVLGQTLQNHTTQRARKKEIWWKTSCKNFIWEGTIRQILWLRVWRVFACA